MSSKDRTIVVQIEGTQKRLSLNIVVVASTMYKIMRKVILQDKRKGAQHERAEGKVTSKIIVISQVKEEHVIN